MLPFFVDNIKITHYIIYMEYKRLLDLNALLKEKSHFLFGPRAIGKSWLIYHQLKDRAIVFDLLDDDIYSRFLRRPKQLSEEIGNNKLVVIDEIQKLPILLDEVHRLIEKQDKIFLLTGSSARKLKKGGGNLLAGRARSANLFPLTSLELTDFDLQKYVNIGGMPLIYNSNDPWLDLKEYTNMYLKEEIQAEAIVRRIDHFARFLDVIGLSSGRELNIVNIASDSGVPPRTVSNFIEILKDTLVAFELVPFQKTKKRKASTKTKLYLFDVGVANYLSGRKELLPRSEAFGDAFEHFIVQEIKSILSYKRIDEQLYYWRSNDFEVDLIVGNKMAIEIKSTEQISDKHINGLKTLREEGIVKEYHIISRDPVKREMDKINVWPYNEFIKYLWLS